MDDCTLAMNVRTEKCTGCALCVDICEGEVLILVNDLPELVRPDDCRYCGHCEEVCPSSALGSARWPVIEWLKCTDCALCADICALTVFELENDDVVIAAPQACNGCGDCVEICPVEAVELMPKGGDEEWIRPKRDSTKK